MASTVKEKKGRWLKEKMLGSGAFGAVSMWRNEDTAECLALKDCHSIVGMTPKQKQQWVTECEMMMRLDHDNVVKGRPIPDVLNTRQELPLMGLEYCVGGDLRQMMTEPENCCGLDQHHILSIVQDISRAVEYIHAQNIIHRDLKPDNIVIQIVDKKRVYKLTDLGYAKDLDQGSIAVSFVGTMQYLAPELFSMPQYTSTVDYWSFGTTVFECITGYRPFLHSVSPLRWQQIVNQKSNEEIHAFFNASGGVAFTKMIPYPNHLNGHFQTYFERWLRMPLAWKPGDRGGEGLSLTSTRPRFFVELDKILKAKAPDIFPQEGEFDLLRYRPSCFVERDNILIAKMINVYYVAGNQVLTYPVKDTDRIKQVQGELNEDTKISRESQELLRTEGFPVKEDEFTTTYCSSVGEEAQLLYLFKKEVTSYPVELRSSIEYPHVTRRLMENPAKAVKIEDQLLAWGQSLFYCKQIVDNFRRLRGAHRTYVMYLLRYQKVLTQCTAQMKAEAADLRAKTDFFQRSLVFDLNKLAAQNTSGLNASRLQKSWKGAMEQQASRANDTEMEISELEQQCKAVDVEVNELQRNPFNQSRLAEQWDNHERKVLKLYEDLKQSANERANKQRPNTEMVNMVSVCDKDYQGVSQAIYAHLSKMVGCRSKVGKLIPDVQRLTWRLKEQKEALLVDQERRQGEVWGLPCRECGGSRTELVD